MTISEHLHTIAGRAVRCLESGAGQPCVLLHAFPLSADMWRPQLEAPPPGWRLIAPDLRGFRGVSSDPDSTPVGRVTMDDYARDVVELLDRLRIDRAVVGGCSMGGYVTFAVRRLAPERVRGVVLANTRPQADSDEGRAKRGEMLALLEREGPAGVAREMLPKLLGRTSHDSRPDVVAHVRRLVEANPADAIDAAIGALRDRPDSTPLLPSIDVPALVIVGDEDTLIPREAADQMFDALPDAQLCVLGRAGHLSSLEAPTAFGRALETFLRLALPSGQPGSE
jgi:pimeloyl-ACP methyl ester carboxylesterase